MNYGMNKWWLHWRFGIWGGIPYCVAYIENIKYLNTLLDYITYQDYVDTLHLKVKLKEYFGDPWLPN